MMNNIARVLYSSLYSLLSSLSLSLSIYIYLPLFLYIFLSPYISPSLLIYCPLSLYIYPSLPIYIPLYLYISLSPCISSPLLSLDPPMIFIPFSPSRCILFLSLTFSNTNVLTTVNGIYHLVCFIPNHFNISLVIIGKSRPKIASAFRRLANIDAASIYTLTISMLINIMSFIILSSVYDSLTTVCI